MNNLTDVTNSLESSSSTDDVAPEPETNGYYRPIKTYVMRAGRMTPAQKRDYEELSHIWCIPYEENHLNFVDVFGNTNPIVVEIGFGQKLYFLIN